MALAMCVKDMMYLHQLLKDFIDVPLPMVLHCDNLGTVQILNSGNKTSRSKHVDIKYFFVRERILDGTVKVVHVASKDNVADLFTKPLPSSTFLALSPIVRGN